MGYQQWFWNEKFKCLDEEALHLYEEREIMKSDACKTAFSQFPQDYFMLRPFLSPMSKLEAKRIIRSQENSVMLQQILGCPIEPEDFESVELPPLHDMTDSEDAD